MSLEGRLSELGLPEVCQLLGSSRKSGTLRVHATIQARCAEIRFAHGVVTDAAQWDVHVPSTDATWERPVPPVADLRALEACMLDLLTWTEGDFRFLAEKASSRSGSPVRIAVEPLLVEAAQRAEVWERVRDRVPHVRAVPAFVDIEPDQLPLLRLVPQEWEVLTRVDGRRDLTELAAVLGRSVVDVAEIVHRLIGARVIALRDQVAMPRRHATPPSRLAIAASDDALESSDAYPDSRAEAEADAESDVVSVATQVLQAASILSFPAANDAPARVPAPVSDPVTASTGHAERLCRQGDAAARRGDLAGALAHWSAALRSDASDIDADRLREAIALAARLHAMLQQGACACLS